MGLFNLFFLSNKKDSEETELQVENQVDLDEEPFYCEAASFERDLPSIKEKWIDYCKHLNKDSKGDWEATVKQFIFDNACFRRFSLRPDLAFQFSYDTWLTSLPPKWRASIDQHLSALVESNYLLEPDALWDGIVENCLRLVQASVNAAEEVYLATPSGLAFADAETKKYDAEMAAKEATMPKNLPIPDYQYVAYDDESNRGDISLGEEDPWFDKAYKVTRDNGYKGSVSRLQKVFNMGYNRAASILNALYDKDLIPPSGSTIDAVNEWKLSHRELVEKYEDADFALTAFPIFRPALAQHVNIEVLKEFWDSGYYDDAEKESINDMQWEKDKLVRIQEDFRSQQQAKEDEYNTQIAANTAKMEDEMHLQELMASHRSDQIRQHNARVEKVTNDLRNAEIFNTGQAQYLKQELAMLMAKKF